MVQFKDNTLSINIPCSNGSSPQEMLAELQGALIGMLHIANVDNTDHGLGKIQASFYHTTNLLSHMQLAPEQMIS